MWADVGNNPVNVVIFAAAALAAVAFIAGFLMRSFRFVRRVTHFLDDWQGQPERPGFVARPGAMERLQMVEDRTRQLKPNGGDHLADKIAAIETRLTGISEHLTARSEQIDQLQSLRNEKATAHEGLERRMNALEDARREDRADAREDRANARESAPPARESAPPARPARRKRTTSESQTAGSD